MQWSIVRNIYRGVAQLVARLLWEQDVGGSNPFTPTKSKTKPSGFGLFFFVTKISIPDNLNTSGCLPALGYEHDRRRWRIQGVRKGAAVKEIKQANSAMISLGTARVH